MKILITGSSGFLGKNLYQKLRNQYEVIGIDKKSSKFADYLIDITNRKKTQDFLNSTRPDVVIHTAALSHVDYCETHQAEAFNTNVKGTKNLVENLKNPEAKFVFISSDYVYDDLKGNFSEEELPNPLNYYGKTKLEGEEIVKGCKNYLILRPTVLFGWDQGGENFFMQIFKSQEQNKPKKVPIDQYSNPTYINLLLEIISKSILKNLTGAFISTGPETINRYQFALKICEIFDFDKKLIIPVKTKDLGQIAPRPLNCSTDSSKIRKILQIEPSSLQESLMDLKAIYTKMNN